MRTKKRFVGGSMRELVMAVGGPLLPGEGVKGYLRRVARSAGLTPWQAHAVWYGLLREPEQHIAIWKLRQIVKQQEIENENAQAELAEFRKWRELLEKMLMASTQDPPS